MPRLPRSFYDEDVPVPEGWSDRWCGYLRLSAAYDAEFEEAGNRGWPRTDVEGTHLSIHTQSGSVLGAIKSLLATFAACTEEPRSP